MDWKGKKLDTYTAIIDLALKLKGNEQKAFIKAYAASGKYALTNIGYLSGYYGPEKMAQIQKVFNVAHPIFGRSIPTAKQAFEAGKSHPQH
jgi:hypothetical protein